jgi:predicted amidohydrolase YtcJ
MRLWSIPLLVTLGLAGCAPSESADLVLTNGTVHTGVDGAAPAEAVAIKDGRILFVGSNADAARYVGDETRSEDLAGATVFAGWSDAHYHLSGVGQREMTLNLEGTDTKAAFLARVKERVDQTPAGEWVTGRGWIETFWTPQAFPSRQDLDAIAPNHPVLLGRADGHASVANSRALEIAGVTRNTPAPFGGAINKDARGEPTGMLIDRAQGLVGRHVPAETDAQRDSAFVIGARKSAEWGWTQVQDAGGNWDGVGRMRRLYTGGQLKLRVYEAIRGPGPDADSLLAAGPGAREFDGRLTVRTIKVSIDGALGSRGAALIAPYSDDPSTHGLVTTDTTAFYAMLVKALERGVQVETHAIGDNGNRLTLDFYERAFRQVPAAGRPGADPLRWRIEHAQIVDPTDIPRFKALEVIPSMQPSHAIGDLYFAPARLGVARLAGAYAWKTFIDLGLPVPGGSDAPVERGDPRVEFYGAVARRDIRGNAGPDSLWHPEQKVTREQALKMFTVWPAYAAFEEDVRGTIEVGKWADLTIFDRDLMTVPESEILTARPVMTVIAGEIVHSAR